MRRRRYSRRSSDTCSFRDRPVCSRRPASPSRSTSSRSTKLCTSSSAPATKSGFATPCSRISVSACSICPRVVARQHAGPGERARPRQAARDIVGETDADRSGMRRRIRTPRRPARCRNGLTTRWSLVSRSLVIGQSLVIDRRSLATAVWSTVDFRAAVSLGRPNLDEAGRCAVIERVAGIVRRQRLIGTERRATCGRRRDSRL